MACLIGGSPFDAEHFDFNFLLRSLPYHHSPRALSKTVPGAPGASWLLGASQEASRSLWGACREPLSSLQGAPGSLGSPFRVLCGVCEQKPRVLHSPRTVPAQSPYSPRTVPVGNLRSPRTLCYCEKGGPRTPFLTITENTGTA